MKVKTLVLELCALSAALLIGLGTLHAGDYGKCSFASDCHAGVKCNSGKCADSAGSSCNFDSDCGGGKCSSGKCQR